MTIMNDKEITSAVMSGDLVIEPFLSAHIQPASYDLSMGDQSYTSGIKLPTSLKDSGYLDLKAGHFAIVTTNEAVKIPPDIVATIGISSYWTRKGILLLNGPQIDPGFEGRLVLGLFNASTRPSQIPYQHRFCTLTFHKLSGPVQKPYRANPEQMKGIVSADDIRYIQEMIDTKTLHELYQQVVALEAHVNDTDKQLNLLLTHTLPELKSDLLKGLTDGHNELHKHFLTLQSWVQWIGGIILTVFTFFAGIVLTTLFNIAQKLP